MREGTTIVTPFKVFDPEREEEQRGTEERREQGVGPKVEADASVARP